MFCQQLDHRFKAARVYYFALVVFILACDVGRAFIHCVLAWKKVVIIRNLGETSRTRRLGTSLTPSIASFITFTATLRISRGDTEDRPCQISLYFVCEGFCTPSPIVKS